MRVAERGPGQAAGRRPVFRGWHYGTMPGAPRPQGAPRFHNWGSIKNKMRKDSFYLFPLKRPKFQKDPRVKVRVSFS